MIHPKYISISAGIGFLLSFLVGIFSGIGFGHVIVRALICAVIFAALSVGISFLNQKFLSDGQADAGSDAPGEKASRVMGGSVDITIDDNDRLPEEDQGPQFNVGLTRAGLRPDKPAQRPPVTPVAPVPPPVQNETPVVAATAPSPASAVEESPAAPKEAGFTPMGLAQVASAGGTKTEAAPTAAESVPQASPAAESASASEAASVAEPAQSASAIAGLEELPDMGMFGGDEGEQAAGDGEGSAEENDFSDDTDTSYVRSVTSIDESAFQDKSASVMAQAIRTVLAKDN